MFSLRSRRAQCTLSMSGRTRKRPSITHDAPLRVPTFAWPVTLYAQAQDNLGIDSVWVEYVRRGVGGVREQGAFGLVEQDGGYSGRSRNRRRRFWGVMWSNTALWPGMCHGGQRGPGSPRRGFFSVLLVLEGELYAFDFEHDDPGVTAQGWRRGQPAFGLRVAYSGEHAWATAAGGAYPAGPGAQHLTFPRQPCND